MEKNEKDWSGRHVRLRFELFVTALIISTFVFYNETKLQASVLVPIDLTHVPKGVVLTVLYIFYFYTLGHFWIRTETERLGISQETAEINAVLQNIVAAKSNFDTRLEPLGPTSVLDFLRSLDGKIEKLVSSFTEDSITMAKYVRLSDRLEALRSAGESPNTTGMDENGRREERLKESTVNVVEAESEIAAYRHNKDKLAEEALTDTRKHLDALSAIMANGAAETVRLANDQLAMDMRALNTIRRNFVMARNSYSWERMWASCYLPAGISTLLVVASLIWYVRKLLAIP